MVMFAVMSQASTFQWGSEGRGYFGTTPLNAGTHCATSYLIALTVSSVSSSMVDDFYDYWKNGGTAITAGGPATSTTLGQVGANTIIADGAGVPNSALVLTENSTYFASIFFVTVAGQDYYYTGDVYLYDKTSPRWNVGLETLDVRSSLPSGTVWTPIPEPTAMALLALGAAAVGLRRRFRK